MGTVRLSFTANKYRRLQGNEISTTEFINEVLQTDAKSICHFLQYNHLDDGGSPEIDDFKIAELSYNAETHTGSVQLSYEIRFFWGCSGIQKTQSAKERCPYIIDPDASTLTLIVPEKLVRDTHDEF